jgi:hypothetical protein
VRARFLAGLLVVAMGGCGSDTSSPTLSVPFPPVTTPLEGTYALVVTPASGCGLPGAPYELMVVASSFDGGSGTELRVTLTEDDSTLALEMLYDPPGWLQGSIATRTWVLAGETGIYLRASGRGMATDAGSGRAEVESGTMNGDVSVDVGDGDVLTCSSLDHRWALLAR